MSIRKIMVGSTEYDLVASKLTEARTIALSGDVSGSTTFDGSGNVTITATVADDSHNHIISNVDGLQTALDGKLPLSGGNITGALAVSGNLIVGETIAAANVSATQNVSATTHKIFKDGKTGGYILGPGLIAELNTDGALTGNALTLPLTKSGTLALTSDIPTTTDSTSASAIGAGTSLPTERDIYYGLPTINDAHNYTSNTNIYAPSSAGTAGYVLVSNGSGAPYWSSRHTTNVSCSFATSDTSTDPTDLQLLEQGKANGVNNEFWIEGRYVSFKADDRLVNITISFSHTFLYPPRVIAVPRAKNTSNAFIGHAIRDITKTGFKFGGYGNGTSDQMSGVYYIAIGK